MTTLRVIVALVILVIWAIGHVLTWFDHPAPPAGVSGMGLLAATYFLGSVVKEKLNEGKEKISGRDRTEG